MILNYFEKIDNKSKAYWLGFLYADGYIRRRQLKIVITPKDKKILVNFHREINCRTNIKYPSSRNILTLYVNSVKMCSDLISHGCVQRKSKIIELPELDSRELYLAFLLGYYDGDGKMGTTEISTGSKNFLLQIKEKFKIPFKIRKEERDGTIEGRVIHSKIFLMCLGAKLFNEMMDNYMDSLPRKRKYFCTNEERITRIKENYWDTSRGKKLNINREDLEMLVWEMPSTRIAEEYGVSDRLITKRCRQLGIEKPPRGYWTKNKAGVV